MFRRWIRKIATRIGIGKLVTYFEGRGWSRRGERSGIIAWLRAFFGVIVGTADAPEPPKEEKKGTGDRRHEPPVEPVPRKKRRNTALNRHRR